MSYYRILDAELDGDLYAGTGYDQTTPFYNMLMDAAETAEECGYVQVPVVQLHGGVYDFYSGYANYHNGSGLCRSVKIGGAGYIEVRGVNYEQTGDETVLRLHGLMQWWYFSSCVGVKFTDLRIEYADDLIYCPKSNPHPAPFHAYTHPDELDRHTIVFDHCAKVELERVKLFGEQISFAMRGCSGVTVNDVSGDVPIELIDCEGVLDVQNLNCPMSLRRQNTDNEMMTVPDMQMLSEAVLCAAHTPTERDVYIPPKPNPVEVTDMFTQETYWVGKTDEPFDPSDPDDWDDWDAEEDE